MDYSPEQTSKIIKWTKEHGIDYLWLTELSAFQDPEFMTKFEQVVPENEQVKFAMNTYKFQKEFGQRCVYQDDIVGEKEYDPNYVIFARRALTHTTPKPEQYWSYEYNMPRKSLRAGNCYRLHSEMLVTTLGKLIEHGVVDMGADPTMGAGENGEIIIDAKPFNADNFLFTFRPVEEQKELEEYLKNGGMTKKDLIKELEERITKKEQSLNEFPSPPLITILK